MLMRGRLEVGFEAGKKRALIRVARGRSKIVMLNALSEMRMQMGNANGFIVVAERFIGQMKCEWIFHSHLEAVLGVNRIGPIHI